MSYISRMRRWCTVYIEAKLRVWRKSETEFIFVQAGSLASYFMPPEENIGFLWYLDSKRPL